MNKQTVFFRKPNGFTLVEVLVVMLILIALSSITLDFTKDFAFQGRYEVTKDRYDKLKRAIIGRPDVLINGQPDISGFVADMGRLPRNIQELLVQNYCMPDYTFSENNPALPTGTYATHKLWCEGIYPAATVKWVEQTTWVDPTSTSLGYGWRGPYISSQKPDYKANAFNDGWGTTATDHNYGWNIVHRNSAGNNITTINTVSDDIAEATQLVIQSYGKDGVANGSDYDEDYPMLQPTININDWLVDIGTGLNVSLKLPKKSGLCHFLSNQSPVGATTAKDCSNDISPAAWGICKITTHTTKAACETNNLFWENELEWCVDVSQQDSTSCATANEKWGVCVNTATTDLASCNGVNDVWWSDESWCIDKSKTSSDTSCTVAGTTGTPPLTLKTGFCHSNDLTCQATGGDWENCILDADSCPSGSSWIEQCKLTIKSCENVANGTWDYSNGHCTLDNEITCISAGGTWTAGTSSCSIHSEQINNDNQCKALGGAMLSVCDNSANCSGSNTWIGSANYCEFTPANCSALIGQFSTSGLCRRSHTDKTGAILSEKTCLDNGGQFWTENRKQICMNVFFRSPVNSQQSYISSDPINITEDGSYQSIHFNFSEANQIDCENNNGVWDTGTSTCSFPVGVGIDAIGIYEYDGDCNSANPFYPANKTQNMDVLFVPKQNINPLSW